MSDDIPSYKPAKPASKSTVSSGTDLLTTMASRCRHLEASIKKLQKQNEEQADVIERLRRDGTRMKQELGKGDEDSDARASLETENARLSAQIEEMEGLLRDHGLIWVGGSGGDIDLDDVDFETLEMKLRALNEVAEKMCGGSMKTKIEGNHARLERDTSNLKIRFYVNGFIINAGPFRSFADGPGREFISEIMDGYFPYELKLKYPNGVVFDFALFPDDVYDVNAARSYKSPQQKSFTGQRRTLQSYPAPKPEAAAFNPPNEWVLDGTGRRVQRGEGRVGPDEFLRNLPERVIANGKVVPIRKDIGDMLGREMAGVGRRVGPINDDQPPPLMVSDPTTPTHVPGPGVDLSSPVNDTGDLSDTPPESPSGPVTAIKVRCGGGSHVISMPYTATVRRLYKLVGKLNPTPPGKTMELVSGRGAAIAGHEETMESAGLTPNAVVVVRFV